MATIFGDVQYSQNGTVTNPWVAAWFEKRCCFLNQQFLRRLPPGGMSPIYDLMNHGLSDSEDSQRVAATGSYLVMSK